MATKQPHPLDSYSDDRLRTGLKNGLFEPGSGVFPEHKDYVEKRLGIKATKAAKKPKSKKKSTGATKTAKAKVPKQKKTSEIAPLPYAFPKKDLSKKLEPMSIESLRHHAKNHPVEWVRNGAKHALAKKLGHTIIGTTPSGAPIIKYKAPAKAKAPKASVAEPAPKKQEQAVKKPPTARDIRAAQLSHPDPVKRIKAINHIGTTWHELDKGIEDPHEDVRAAAAGHENVSIRHLLRGLRDPSKKVRIAAVSNPKSGRGILYHAAHHIDDPDVSEIAQKKLDELVKPKAPKKEKSHKDPSAVSGTSSQAAAHNAGLFFGKLAKGLTGLGAGVGAGVKKSYRTGKNLVKAGAIGHAAAKKAFANLQAQES